MLNSQILLEFKEGKGALVTMFVHFILYYVVFNKALLFVIK